MAVLQVESSAQKQKSNIEIASTAGKFNCNLLDALVEMLDRPDTTEVLAYVPIASISKEGRLPVHNETIEKYKNAILLQKYELKKDELPIELAPIEVIMFENGSLHIGSGIDTLEAFTRLAMEGKIAPFIIARVRKGDEFDLFKSMVEDIGVDRKVKIARFALMAGHMWPYDSQFLDVSLAIRNRRSHFRYQNDSFPSEVLELARQMEAQLGDDHLKRIGRAASQLSKNMIVRIRSGSRGGHRQRQNPEMEKYIPEWIVRALGCNHVFLRLPPGIQEDVLEKLLKKNTNAQTIGDEIHIIILGVIENESDKQVDLEVARIQEGIFAHADALLLGGMLTAEMAIPEMEKEMSISEDNAEEFERTARRIARYLPDILYAIGLSIRVVNVKEVFRAVLNDVYLYKNYSLKSYLNDLINNPKLFSLYDHYSAVRTGPEDTTPVTACMRIIRRIVGQRFIAAIKDKEWNLVVGEASTVEIEEDFTGLTGITAKLNKKNEERFGILGLTAEILDEVSKATRDAERRLSASAVIRNTKGGEDPEGPSEVELQSISPEEPVEGGKFDWDQLG